MKVTKRDQIIITAIITLLVWGHVLWDYIHDGIPVHYLFMDDTMPPFPNWLGAIILPFFSWISLGRIRERVNNANEKDSIQLVIGRFLCSFTVAITIAICFVNGIEIPGFVFLSIFALAFIFPLYKSEYPLGWVLGASYTFGAMIPMLFAVVFAGVFFVFYQIKKGLIRFFK